MAQQKLGDSEEHFILTDLTYYLKTHDNFDIGIWTAELPRTRLLVVV